MARQAGTSGKIRVIINALHAKTGGGVTYLRNILPFLARAEDLELHLFLHEDQFSLFGTPPENVRLHLLSFPNGFSRLLFWEQLVLPVLAREMGADVTFSLANYGPLFAPNPVIVLRNSLAVVWRERRIGKWGYWIGLAAVTFASLLGCRQAIAVSDYARRALGFGMPWLFARKTEVIYHGVDERFRHAVPPDERRSDRLLVVSDVYVQKNIHTLIRALPQILARHPGLRLQVAGKLVDLPYHRELQELAAGLGVAGAVDFLGGQSPENLIEHYRNCTIFLFPSTVETFGNPLVEAMACGAPVICSSSSAMPEIAGDAVLYVDPFDVEAMVDRVLELLGDSEARARLGAVALRQAERYSWEATGLRTAEVLRRAAGKAAP